MRLKLFQNTKQAASLMLEKSESIMTETDAIVTKIAELRTLYDTLQHDVPFVATLKEHQVINFTISN